MGCQVVHWTVGYHTEVQTEEFRALVRAVVEDGRSLARAEARALLAMLLTENSTAAEAMPDAVALPLAGMLAAMARRGETAEELCGFAEAMRAAATEIPLSAEERASLVDTCGTGGDGLDTLNVSTAAALVAAGAGAWIAKHGNRAVTSRCGSADVLEALGVPIQLLPADAAECLRRTRFIFLLAQGLQPAMRRVGPVRRALPFRTIFNLAGPLANPAGAESQVIGVFAENRIGVLAGALRLLGVREAWVVHGRVQKETYLEYEENLPPDYPTRRGLDELTVTGPSVYARIREGEIDRCFLEPTTLGLRRCAVEEVRGGADARANAAMIEAILRGGDRGARREIVLLNAAAALVVAGRATTLAEGLAQAGEAVDRGDAVAVLDGLRAFRPGGARA